jgi:thiol:disulfide interchange protein
MILAISIGSMDPVWATLILSVLVLVAGTVLCWKALGPTTQPDIAKQVFAVVGVLFGLLAAGGLGTLFAHANAETAENAAASAGSAAATEVKGQVEEQVEEAINAPPPQEPGGK